jgi:hypothetical protein
LGGHYDGRLLRLQLLPRRVVDQGIEPPKLPFFAFGIGIGQAKPRGLTLLVDPILACCLIRRAYNPFCAVLVPNVSSGVS